MGLIDSGSKSSRLLASRRYTHNTFTTAQESFTNVLDLRAEEIFTRAHLIPSSSLPYSGSSQLGLTYSTKGQSVSKYWYRQQLTKSNTNNEVWFFLNPTGSGDGVGAQLINSNQQTNFISPKYAVSSLATSTTEDSTPGYLAVLYKSTAVASSEETGSLGSGDIVSTNDYVFDYKTGVVQFLNSTKDPSDSDYIYMTAYQYVGDTLKSGLEIEGQVSASNLLVTDTLKATTLSSPEITLATASIAAITASISRIDSEIDTNTANITLATASIAAITSSISRLDTESSLATASIVAITASISRLDSEAETNESNITLATASIAANETGLSLATASIAAITSSLSTISGTGELQGLGTTSSPLFNSVTASADVSASGNIYATGNLDIDGTSNFSSDVTIASDLNVIGTVTATEIHTTFISSSVSVATGSNKFGDATDDHHSFTGSLSVSSSLSVTGSVTIDGTLAVDEIGAFTAGGAIDFGNQNMTNVDIDSGDITGVTFGSTTSTIISGSFTSVSSSIATRFDSRETDMVLATASIAAITASISRIDSEIDTNSANMTLATASIAAITASISRIDSEIDTNSANMTLATASIAAITASVSRIDSEIDTNAANIALATASIAAITASLGQPVNTDSSVTFNSVDADGGVTIDNITIDGTEIDLSSGDFTLDVAGDIEINADGGDVVVKDDVAVLFNVSATKISGSSTSTGSFGRVSTTTIDLASIQGNWTNAGNTIADLGTVTTADINGGTIDGITSLTAGGDLDIGSHGFRAATITADGLTATRVSFAGTDGLLSDDSDLTFATATLSATNLTTTGTIKNMALVSGSSVSTGSFGRVNIAGTLDAGAVTDGLAAIIVAQIDDDEIPIAKLAEDSVTYVAGTGLTGGGVAALGNSATINAVGGTGITANANELIITPAQTTIESIYKADLVIGEDAQTQIDFETVNEIHFDVNNIELLNLNGAKISGSSVSTGSFGSLEVADKVQSTLTIVGDTTLQNNLIVTGHITASGNISSSGIIIADTFQSTGGSVDGISFTDDLNITGNITASGGVSVGEMSIPSVSIMSSSIATRFDSREADMTLATASIAALTASISRLNDEISTDDTDMTLATASIAAITASIAEMKEFTKADTISGSFTAVSSSIATRFDSRETDMTLATASIAAITASVSRIDSEIDTNSANMTLATASIAAITASIAEMKEFTKADTISGSFTALSGSVATRFDSRETDMTLATASIAAITASISRLNAEISTDDTDMTLATASIAAITASIAEMKEFTNATTISGSFTSLSGSVATRFDSRETDMTLATASIELNESNITLATASIAAITASVSRIDSEIDTNSANMTLATASIAAITASVAEMKEFTVASTISGSFTAVSSSIASRFDSRETDMTLATASIAAITASIADNLDQAVKTDSDVTFGTITSGDITSTGTITAVEVHTTFISSSIAVISGSNNFGDDTSDHHSFTGSLSVSSSLSVTGSVTVVGTVTADEIGAFTAGGAIDFGNQNMTNVDIDSGDITGVTFGSTTSTIISGSTTAVSSSIATRFDSRESDMTLATASIEANETNTTLATASIAAITASISRIDSEIDTNSANMTLATASIAAITASITEMKEFTNATTISGSFTAVSSSIATRFDSRETDMTLATASIAANETGLSLATASIAAITASISRIDSEIDTNSANMTLATASISRLDIESSLATASIAAITASISRLNAEISTDDTDMTLATASIAAITASIARLNTDIIFQSTGSFYRTHNDIQITGSLSVSGLITGSYSGLEVGQKYKHTQTTPANTWTVSHGFDYQYVNIDVYNGSDEIVIPASVVATDSNIITVSFNTPVSGVAIISTGGQAVDELGKNVIFEQSTASTNWQVTHSIGEQYPAVTVYDDNDDVIIPERINAVDASTMNIIFTNAVSGNANISVGGGQLRNAITGSKQLSFDNFGDISGSVSSTGSFGYLNVVGDAVIGGNLTFGDANTDSININAEINSNIVPDADNTYNIGSSSKNWRFGHIEELSATNVTASGDLDINGIANFAGVVTANAGVVVDNFTLDGTELDLSSGDFTLDVAGDIEINADGGDVVIKDGVAVLLDVSATKISGSAVSTGSFGNVNVAEMSVTSISALSSSIASRLDNLSGDVIALSIALG